MDDRQWAAEWLDLFYGQGRQIGEDIDEYGFIVGFTYSDADLAEAVRQKCDAGRAFPGTSTERDKAWDRCTDVWQGNGSLAFIRAVREVVDGRD